MSGPGNGDGTFRKVDPAVLALANGTHAGVARATAGEQGRMFADLIEQVYPAYADAYARTTYGRTLTPRDVMTAAANLAAAVIVHAAANLTYNDAGLDIETLTHFGLERTGLVVEKYVAEGIVICDAPPPGERA